MFHITFSVRGSRKIFKGSVELDLPKLSYSTTQCVMGQEASFLGFLTRDLLLIWNTDDVDVKKPDEKPEWIIAGETKVVKAALLLPHGNADVERCENNRVMSESNRLVTAERNKLGEDTINGLRAMKDNVKFSDPQHQKPESIPINTKNFPFCCQISIFCLPKKT